MSVDIYNYGAMLEILEGYQNYGYPRTNMLFFLLFAELTEQKIAIVSLPEMFISTYSIRNFVYTRRGIDYQIWNL